MNFTNREEYLAATATWKADYKSLIVDIRRAKIEYKESQRAFAKCGSYNYNSNSTDEKNKAYLVAEREMLRAMSHRSGLRSKATEMIEERHASKVEAGRQMKAR
jgi:hypothetical protein